MRRYARIAAVLLSVCLAVGQSQARDPDVLRVALLPDESAATVIQNNQPLKAYLEDTLDKEIELVVTADYSSMIEAARHGRIELAYFGPVSYVLAQQRADLEAFAALKRDGATTYRGYIITHVDSGIESLEDIAGHDMAYGDPASTGSHLIPKSMMKAAGLSAGSDYREHFLGAHDAVALSVQNRNAAAGGLSELIFGLLVERGTIDDQQVKVLAESDPFPQYPWVMQADLAPELKQRIRDAFLNLDDPAVLEPFNADAFGAMSDADYDVVRDVYTIVHGD